MYRQLRNVTDCQKRNSNQISKVKWRSQALSLLGISLFSISLMQLRPVQAQAATDVQTEVTKSQVTDVNSTTQSVPDDQSTDTSKNSVPNKEVSDANHIPAENSLPDNQEKSAGKVKPVTNPEVGAAQSVVPESAPVSAETTSVPANGITDKSSDTASEGAVTSENPTPSNLVVIKNGDRSVQLDNKLKLSVDQASTLGKVTATNSDNFTYNEGTQTATITDPTAADAVTAEYKNVGTYQGKSISAQVTITNILKHTDEHPVPNSNLTVDQIQLTFMPYFEGGIKTYNVGQDEVTIKFFDEAGNQVAINGDGYITVGSLNGPSTSTAGNEYINYGNGSTSTYVTEDSVVKYQTNPLTGSGNAYVGVTNDFKDVLGAPTSENGAVTFQLSGNAFTFLSGTTRYTLKNANHHWSYTLTTFSSATVAPAVIPAPVLTVDKSSAKAGDAVNYTLNQQVNVLGEDTMLRYQSWSEVVTLPTEVNYQQASLLDSTGAVIPSATFTWDAKAHQLTVTLSEDYLQNTMTLNGETYQIKIGTAVNNGVANGEVGPASGQVTIDNGTKDSNGVSTIYVAPVVSVPITTKTMTVHYYKKGTTEKLAPDQTFEVVDGQSYVAPGRKIKGYRVNSQLDTTGIYSGLSEAVYYYTVQKEIVRVYYMYNDPEEGEVAFKVKTLTGVYGSSYSTHALNLLDGGGDWILSKSPRNYKGMFKDKIINVYYYYLIDKAKYIDHEDGSGTYIDWTADGRLAILDEDHSDWSETLVERRNFSRNQYRVTFWNKKGEMVKSGYYGFGKTYILTDRTDGNIYKLKIGKNGSISESVMSSQSGIKYDYVLVSESGKLIKFKESKADKGNLKKEDSNKKAVSRKRNEANRLMADKLGLMRKDEAGNTNFEGEDVIETFDGKSIRTLPQTGDSEIEGMLAKIFGLLISIVVTLLMSLERISRKKGEVK